MTVSEMPGAPGVYTVDTNLMGMPGVMSAYVVDAERPAVIDPGAAPAVDHLLDALADLEVAPDDVAFVIPTHVHLDHAGAAGALARECPNAEVLVHERGRSNLVDPDELAALVDSARRALGDVADAYGDPDLVPADSCRAIAGGDAVDLGDRSLDVVDAPGHAPHQVCLYEPAAETLFAADATGMTVGGDLLPTTPPPDFDLDASLATLDRLAALEPAVLCYGHFGARTDAGEALAAYRHLLPEWVAAVAEAKANNDDRAAVVDALRATWPMPTLEGDVAGVLRWLAHE
jgi:glyoxylase-like metal-dependent hydrolase (beta-lactamase superfamily II)